MSLIELIRRDCARGGEVPAVVLHGRWRLKGSLDQFADDLTALGLRIVMYTPWQIRVVKGLRLKAAAKAQCSSKAKLSKQC